MGKEEEAVSEDCGLGLRAGDVGEVNKRKGEGEEEEADEKEQGTAGSVGKKEDDEGKSESGKSRGRGVESSEAGC